MNDVIGKLLKDNNMPDTPTARAIYRKMLEPDEDDDTQVYQKPWVGLTVEERNACLVSADPCEALADPEAKQLMEDVEAALKKKNT